MVIRSRLNTLSICINLGGSVQYIYLTMHQRRSRRKTHLSNISRRFFCDFWREVQPAGGRLIGKESQGEQGQTPFLSPHELLLS